MTDPFNPQPIRRPEIVPPVLPYADGVVGRSSGWSGSETSEARAHREDADGTTSDRQQRVINLLDVVERIGCTWQEVADALGWHHGSASGALSALHRAGMVARLAEKRNRSKVYVLPGWVDGRDVEAFGSNKGLTLAQRILSRCEPNDWGCLVWTGALSDKGYGNIGVEGGTEHVHKVLYEAAYGPLGPGLVARHTCDNPPCCNPAHLIPGTNAENTADMLARDRQPDHMRPRETCQHGHSDWYTAPNGDRRCRVCRAASQQARRRS